MSVFAKVDNINKNSYGTRDDYRFLDSARVAEALGQRDLRLAEKPDIKAPENKNSEATAAAAKQGQDQQVPGTGGCSCCGKGGCSAATQDETAEGPELFREEAFKQE